MVPPCSDHRVGGRALDRRPLLDLLAAAGGREHGEVGGGTIGVDVGEAAADLPGAARRGRRDGLDRLAHGGGDALVEGGEPLPGDRRLERLESTPIATSTSRR